MALKDVKSVLAKKKAGAGKPGPLMPNIDMGAPGVGAPMMPQGVAEVPEVGPDMGSGAPLPTAGGDPQALMEEGEQKVLEGLQEIKQAQAMMGGGVEE